jgi:hypothetical protein
MIIPSFAHETNVPSMRAVFVIGSVLVALAAASRRARASHDRGARHLEPLGSGPEVDVAARARQDLATIVHAT